MIQFRMRKIKVEQFAILSEADPKTMNNISLDTRMSVSVAPEIRSISVDLRFVFHNDDMQIIVLETRCFFEIAEQSWKELNSSGQLEIPDDFLGHLALHTVGTARGILFCKTEGTKYASLILPTINVIDLINHKNGQRK